jgi:beta-phosphoglucomutase-like phosphatase (HAD superfamily)
LITRAKVQCFLLAIATTTSRRNIESLLAVTLGLNAHGDFEAIITGEDVAKKKPDPEAYRLALARLGVSADEAIAFEDSKNGVVAARGAGLQVIVTPSLYTERDDFSGASFIVPTLEAIHLASIGLADGLWR